MKIGIRNFLDSKCEGRFAESIGIFRRALEPKRNLSLEKKLKAVLQIIILNPKFFPKSTHNPILYKAFLDKNNYIVYRENKEKNRIEIINFRGTRQRPIH